MVCSGLCPGRSEPVPVSLRMLQWDCKARLPKVCSHTFQTRPKAVLSLRLKRSAAADWTSLAGCTASAASASAGGLQIPMHA